MDRNPYRSIESEVLEVITETPTIATFKFQPKEKITFLPGQFMELSIPGAGEAPFTPSSFCGTEDTMEITIVRVGKVTDRIHGLKPGDIVGLRGPYGKGYPLDAFRGKEVYIVGGGVGLAPIRTLMYSLFEMKSDLKKLVYRAGCRNPAEFIFREEINQWLKRDNLDIKLTVDQSEGKWKHNVGVVTTIMDNAGVDAKTAVGVACGPPVMMKFVTLKFIEMGFKDKNIYLSMEKNMSCGFGKCGHCRLGTFYCCKDGPVFDYAAIKDFPGIWE